MLNLVKYLKQEIGLVVAIFVLLVMQAYCDLSLPQYTSDIVNVGIAKYGIEKNTPEDISADTLHAVQLFLNDADRAFVNTCYTAQDYWVEGAAVAGYRLNTMDKANTDRLEEMLALPMMAVFYMEQSPDYSVQMLEQMPQEMRMSMLTQLTESIDAMGDSAIGTATATVIMEEKETLGIDKSVQQIQYLLMTGLKMLAVALGCMLCAVAAGLLASKAAAHIAMNLRLKMFGNVLSFSSAEMDQFSTASLITRSTNDIQQVQMVLVMILRMVLYAPILGIGGVFKVLTSSPSMSWLIGVAVIVIIGVVGVLMAVTMPRFKKMQTLVDRVNLVAREILTGLSVIRAFSREKHEEKRFDGANKELTGTQLFTSRVMALMMPIMMMIMNCLSVAIVWFGGIGVDNGTIQVGDMIAFLTYAMQIVFSFLMITMMSIMLPRAGVAAKRIDEVINMKPSINDSAAVKDNELDGSGMVTFDHVSFRYPNADDDVLSDITFTAKPGQTTAIIGSTGNGKSTLVNLIPRFYDVTQGSIRLDGVDIREISQNKLREKIGYVPQKAVLFSGTIASNIRYGREEATDAEVVHAAEVAQSEDFIQEKFKKYEDPIAQGGSNVSGGQKQRLSIARAIAKKPQVFIFDDSFSALDYKTDVALRNALKHETGNATVIIVAQRISTILHAEQIIVLDEGRIAGIGTHEELMKNNEIYRQIAQSQLSGADLESVAEA